MNSSLSRRELLKGGLSLVALALAQHPLSAFGFSDPAEGAEDLPFLDKQSGANGIKWENLRSWVTPSDQLYKVQHYNVPKIDPARWQLEIGGLVRKPRTLTLAELRSRRRKTITATLEC